MHNWAYTVKNIWKSYIWTADKDMNESDPRSDVHYLGSSENKAWKKFSGLYGIWTHDLCESIRMFGCSLLNVMTASWCVGGPRESWTLYLH